MRKIFNNRNNLVALGVFILSILAPEVLSLLEILSLPLRLIIYGIGIFIAICLVFWGVKSQSQEQSETNEGLILLSQLDDVYIRLKEITRKTILKLRSKGWEDVTSAYSYLMGLTDIDIEAAIEDIMVKNVYYVTTGKPMTVEEDSKKLNEQIMKSPFFTRNPEHIAKDASIILQEKVPHLKKKLDHDRKYINIFSDKLSGREINSQMKMSLMPLMIT